MDTKSDISNVRQLKIYTSQDKMNAYITIKYLEEVLKDDITSALYTASDIRSELDKAGIIFGVIDIALESYGLKDCLNQLIATGQNCINAVDDKITINFSTTKSFDDLLLEDNGNIDFKSIGSIEPVRCGDVIASYIKGSQGLDGSDVFGHKIKHKERKILKLKAASGCQVIDGNKVVASIDGKLSIKDGTFNVYKVHEIRGDVDMKSGNIKFIGDIIIYGGVKENMSVDCGSFLKIYKDIERAEVKSQNDIEIKGNVITSNITGGGEDVTRLNGITDLESIKGVIKNIIIAFKQVREFDLLPKDTRDGEIIKILIENKFKNLTRLCIRTIAFLNMQKLAEDEEALVTVFREKLIFFGPINIQHYKELNKVIYLIDEKLKYLKELGAHPVEVKFSYCQDSKIESTGNIILTGKGEYVSEIISSDGVYFTNIKSATRGGSITSKNVIKCASVGSPASVPTILKVESSGHIWIDKAFQNTKIIVGTKEYIFKEPGRNIHAFIGSEQQLVVEQLKLLEVKPNGKR